MIAKPRAVARYKMWKQSLYKWDSFVHNRHRSQKICDAWSRFIIDNVEGQSVVFNSGGLFFRDFIPDITVVEHVPCPVLDLENVLYCSHGVDFDTQYDNLIMINPISLKYNHSILDFLTKPGLSRMGMKPNLLKWIRRPGKIYLSTSDWHICFDRLRLSVYDMVAIQLKELREHDIKCEYLEITDVNSDVENGNIKLVFTI